MAKKKLKSPELFINRELSWLEFNDRVLREGLCRRRAALERLKFLAIVSSNLGEFFLVRVAGLMRARAAGVRRRDPAGMTPAAQLTAISARVHRMVQDQAEGRRRVLAALAGHGLAVLEPHDWTAAAAVPPGALRQGNPAGADAAGRAGAHPPPLLPGQQWYVAAVLAAGHDARPPAERIVVVPVPTQFSRWISLPAEQGVCLARLDDVIAANVAAVFAGCEVLATAVFRITRDADVRSAATGRATCCRRWRRRCSDRRRRPAVRLTISARPDRRIKQWLDRLAAPGRPRRSTRSTGLLDAAALMEIADWPGFDDLKNADWPPQPPRDLIGAENLWDAVSDHDVLLLPSLRELRSGGAAGRAGRRRPGRAGHQADALPHQRRFADRPRPGPGGAERQGSDRAGRVAGPLRRGPQRPVGPAAGRRRLPRHLRHRRLQDPRQGAC